MHGAHGLFAVHLLRGGSGFGVFNDGMGFQFQNVSPFGGVPGKSFWAVRFKRGDRRDVPRLLVSNEMFACGDLCRGERSGDERLRARGSIAAAPRTLLFDLSGAGSQDCARAVSLRACPGLSSCAPYGSFSAAPRT